MDDSTFCALPDRADPVDEIERVVVGKVDLADELDPKQRQAKERAAKIMRLTLMKKLLKSDSEPSEVVALLSVLLPSYALTSPRADVLIIDLESPRVRVPLM